MLTRAPRGQYCDYCKSRFGVNNLKGQKPALWTVISQHPKAKGNNRSYCGDCAKEVTTWADGTNWGLDSQAEYLMKQETLPNV